MDWDLIIGTTLRAFVGVQACYFALAAIGLNVHYGYTGLANFGQVAFVAVGSYCLLYTSPSPRDLSTSRMPSSA